MKKTILILLLFLIGFISMGQTVYIDPTNTVQTGQDGSINHPWDRWTDFAFVNGTTYLQKCGTIHLGGNILIDQKSNITIGSYGTGAKPKIKLTGINSCFWTKRSTNITFDNLDLEGLDDGDGVGISITYHWGDPTVPTTNVIITNCDIHSMYNGVRSLPQTLELHTISNVTVKGCNIWNILEDGIYFANVNNTTIEECHIWDVNMVWFERPAKAAPGDGIQLTGNFENWLIKNCIIDRRTTAGKFCVIIANDYAGAPGYNGSFIGNTIYPTKDTLPRYPGDETGGAGFAFYANYNNLACDIDVSYNKFIGRDHPDGGPGQPGIYIVYANRVNCYYNVLDSTSSYSSISFCNYAYVCNNTMIGNIIGEALFKVTAISMGGEMRNNMGAGNTISDPIGKGYSVSPEFIMSNNLNVKGNGTTYNTLLGINNWQTGDFTPKAGSPAIDAGFDYAGYYKDFAGTTVPIGTHRDIGAYEYVQSNPVPSPIQNVTVTDITNISCKGNWDKVSDATGYKITLMKDNAPVAPYQNYDVGDVSTYSITGLIPNSSYSFFVKGYNLYGEGYGLGKDFTTLCNTPIITDFSTPLINFNVGVSVTFSSTIVACDEPTYSWYFENGVPQTSALKNPVVKWNTPGKYLVSLTITNNGGTTSLTKDDYVNVTPIVLPPVASFAITIPMNTKFTFTDFSANNPTEWEWYFQSGYPEKSKEKNPVVYWKKNGRFDVVLTVRNSGGTTTLKMPGYVNVGRTITPNPTPDPTPINENLGPR